jgi:DNA-binding NtrC family response regulator
LAQLSGTEAASSIERPSAAGRGAGGSLETLAEMERQHILAALEQSKGNRTHAARMLEISIRTLRNKLNEYQRKGQMVPREKAVR